MKKVSWNSLVLLTLFSLFTFCGYLLEKTNVIILSGFISTCIFIYIENRIEK